MTQPDQMRLAFIGGTGPEGRGLALRFAAAGHAVVIGSRSAERGGEVAGELRRQLPESRLEGMQNVQAAELADAVFLTIPYGGLTATAAELGDATRDKVVISTIAPVEFQNGRPVALRVPAGSAAQEVAVLLPEARVASGFQTVDAHQLQDLHASLDTDVIVCSDDQEVRRTVIALANELPGIRGLSGGRLAASRYVEECTALLITLNRIYRAHSGVRFTGIDR